MGTILFYLQLCLFTYMAKGKITLRCDDEFKMKYKDKISPFLETRKSRSFRDIKSVLQDSDRILDELIDRRQNGTIMKGRLIFEIEPPIRFPVPGFPMVAIALKDAQMGLELVENEADIIEINDDDPIKPRKKKKKSKKKMRGNPGPLQVFGRRKRSLPSSSNNKMELFKKMSPEKIRIGKTNQVTIIRKRKYKRSKATSARRTEQKMNKCDPTRRIIGGHEVRSIEQVPYMAFINTGCGGAIISDNWMISAAHCVYEELPTLVYVGSTKLYSGCRHDIKKVVIHPKFDMKHLQYDISLIQVVDNFLLSPAVRTITLSNKEFKPGTCGIVTGWGAQEFNGVTSPAMQETTLPVLPTDKCPKRFRVQTGQFCAGYPDARSDTCQGDSGGPFVVAGVLTGIVSFGYKCAVPDMPGVYVDISFHRKWITKVSGV